MSAFQGPVGLMGPANLNAVQGQVQGPQNMMPGLMSPTDWSQVAYQMAGSPKQGGMYAGVPVPGGTAPTNAPSGFANSGLGGTTLGILSALAKNPTVVKTLGSDVSNLFGGSAAGSAGSAVASAAAGTAGQTFAPAGSTVTDTAGGTSTLFGDAPSAGTTTSFGASPSLMNDALTPANLGDYAFSPGLEGVSTNAVMPAAQAGYDAAAASLASSGAAPAADFATGGAATAGDAGAASGFLGPALGIAGLVGMGIADFTAKDPNQAEQGLLANSASGLKTGINTPTTVPGLAGL